MAVLAGVYGKKEPEYAGCVVDMYEHNGYNDSYWYAVCWDRGRQELVAVEYDTTAAAGGGWAEIDATEDVLREMYRKFKSDARKFFDTKANEEHAKKYDKGDDVVVVRGTKIKKGTVGTVFWVGESYNQYSRRYEKRAGIEVDGERKFLPAEYLERAEWQKHMVHGKKRKELIRRDAVNCMPVHYRHLFY